MPPVRGTAGSSSGTSCEAPTVTRSAERVLNPVLGKSLVVYATKPDGAARDHCRDDLPDAARPPQRGRGRRRPPSSIADAAAPDRHDPVVPGRPRDPWNHVEAAMALDVAGLHGEAERAYEWLAAVAAPRRLVAPYYLADGVEDAKLDTNVIAYVAAGRVAPLAAHRRPRLPRDDVAGRRASHRLRARPADAPRRDHLGPARRRHAVVLALLTGSSSICHSLRCAIALAEQLGHERPDWELSAATLGRRHRATQPDAFAPKHRWAMDWYYPVLAGVLTGRDGRRRLADRWDTFVLEGRGVRCVSDRPWVTAPRRASARWPTSAVGDADARAAVRRGRSSSRHDDGSYWTGIVYPDDVHFPGGERTTYTAAAVVLAADALGGGSASLGLFRRRRRCCRVASRRASTPVDGRECSTASAESRGARAASRVRRRPRRNAALERAEVDLVRRPAAVGGVGEHVVDGEQPARRDVRRPPS